MHPNPKIILFPCVMCVFYRIYNISLFPFCLGDSSFLLSCCNYVVYILYMPVLFLRAQFPPPFNFVVLSLFLGIKKRLLLIANTIYHTNQGSSTIIYLIYPIFLELSTFIVVFYTQRMYYISNNKITLGIFPTSFRKEALL